MSTTKKAVTRLLQDYDLRDKKAFDRLFDFVHKELQRIARGRRRKWQGNHTLDTKAILHEAYLKLVDQSMAEWESRTHFYAAASKAMRHILINYARDQSRQKRGGDRQKITFDQVDLTADGEIGLSENRHEAMIVLNKVLNKLEQENVRQSKIVEYRFFGGMTIKETASALGVSPSTIKRGWKTARLWLYRELEKEMNQ